MSPIFSLIIHIINDNVLWNFKYELQNFNESVFTQRLTFLVLNSFNSCYFSKKSGTDFLEGIVLHLHGIFPS